MSRVHLGDKETLEPLQTPRGRPVRREAKVMLASRPLEPLGRRDLERRVLQDRLQMLPVPRENRARERRVLPDLAQVALTEARELQDPPAIKESEDQIKRLPWPLRLRARLLLS